MHENYLIKLMVYSSKCWETEQAHPGRRWLRWLLTRISCLPRPPGKLLILQYSHSVSFFRLVPRMPVVHSLAAIYKLSMVTVTCNMESSKHT